MNKVELAPGITVYKNINLDINNFLINLNENQWLPEYVQNINGEIEIDKKIRNTLSVEIPSTPKSSDSETIKQVSQSIIKSITESENDYCSVHEIVLKSHQPFKILKYDKDAHFSTHSDDGGGTFRRTSIVYYLNDDYEGGEIEFIKFNIIYKPEAGDLIIFPSSYAYMHRVLPVRSGTRYSIASWLR